ncbi:RNA polymerase sigma factor RpoE [Minicystis rosea]|nr:RNA polymerase sigma factor RpoE [Minicystis rosea]
MSPKATARATDGPAAPPFAERPAFDDVFSEHARYVGRTLRYLGVAEAELEDACQEVFIAVHRRLADFEPGGSVRAWLRQICVHVAQNQRRTRRRRREEGGADAIEIEIPATQHDAAERTEMRERLLALLSRLDEQQRAVFVLYEIERMPMAEVAAALSCPLQTAYSRLHAARARLEEAVRRNEASP